MIYTVIDNKQGGGAQTVRISEICALTQANNELVFVMKGGQCLSLVVEKWEEAREAFNAVTKLLDEDDNWLNDEEETP